MKTQVLLGLTGAATLAWNQAAAVDLNEHNVRGPRDVTALTNRIPLGTDNNAPPKCTIKYIGPNPRFARAMAFGGTTPISYTGYCTGADIKQYEERLAQAVRERLGDRGRH